MKRLILFGLLLAASSGVWSQAPQVSFYGDFRPTFFFDDSGQLRARWYDLLGESSVVGARAVLEPGLRVSVAQRLQRFGEGAGDNSWFDEFFIEQRGSWRVGLQPLPFGRGVLMDERGIGLRLDADLLIAALPFTVVVVDNGSGRQRGAIARVGGVTGLSVAVGNHFGISPGSLTPLRRADQSPGAGEGYQLVIGADVQLVFGRLVADAEFVSFRTPDGEEPSREVGALRLAYVFRPDGSQLLATIARDFSQSETATYLGALIPVNRELTWNPFVRITNDGVQEVGITARFRL